MTRLKENYYVVDHHHYLASLMAAGVLWQKRISKVPSYRQLGACPRSYRRRLDHLETPWSGVIRLQDQFLCGISVLIDDNQSNYSFGCMDAVKLHYFYDPCFSTHEGRHG